MVDIHPRNWMRGATVRTLMGIILLLVCIGSGYLAVALSALVISGDVASEGSPSDVSTVSVLAVLCAVVALVVGFVAARLLHRGDGTRGGAGR